MVFIIWGLRGFSVPHLDLHSRFLFVQTHDMHACMHAWEQHSYLWSRSWSSCMIMHEHAWIGTGSNFSQCVQMAHFEQAAVLATAWATMRGSKPWPWNTPLWKCPTTQSWSEVASWELCTCVNACSMVCSDQVPELSCMPRWFEKECHGGWLGH